MSSIVDSYSQSNFSGFAPGLGDGTNNYLEIGQSFTGDGQELDSASFYLKKIGSITGDLYVRVYAHSGTFGTSSVPTGSPIAVSESISASSVSSSDFELVLFNFIGVNRVVLEAGTKYVVTVGFNVSTTSSNTIAVGCDSTSPAHIGNFCRYDTSWNHTNLLDTIFYVYGGTSTGSHSASVSPVTATTNIPSVSATYESVQTAVVSPITLTTTVPTVTAQGGGTASYTSPFPAFRA